ncbi:MAG: winged helix-turn-helix transcriptional regulator [Clostridiales bacterium]|nr:winged helix-turn-helix transcriptional regulator [Clostridiales bacterium]
MGEPVRSLERYKAPAEVLKAMAHPLRLCILMALYEQEGTSVTALRDQMRAPQSTVSQQLGILRRAGLVSAERTGKLVSYRIADSNIRGIVAIMMRLMLEEE